MTRQIWLDEHRESSPPPGARLIENEVIFLRHTLTEEPLYVRGVSLCRWARSLAEARIWACTELGKPSDELRAACASITEEQATRLTERLGAHLWNLSRPLQPREVARVLWPADFWLAEPGWEQAAQWLCWLIEHNLQPGEIALVQAVALQWEHETDGLLRRCYSATGREQAIAIIEEWLGLTDTHGAWEAFPLRSMPPGLVNALTQRVRRRLMDSNGRMAGEWIERGPAREIGRLVAREAKAYYQVHADQLNPEWLDELARFLNPLEMAELRRLCPPADPGLPPDDLAKLESWYAQQYLPWREWTIAAQDSKSSARARELGRHFGEWYLRAYPKMVVGAAGHELVSWMRTRQLAQDGSLCVTLLVVLDGLGIRDRSTLVNHILSHTNRLTVKANEVALTPIPTVTEFAKPALLSGLPPDQALFDESENGVVSRVTEVIQALSATPAGKVVTWRLVEPDQTYHRVRDQRELQADVDSRLRSIADKLHQITEEIPAETQLRIVLTADHGRLLGKSHRTLEVPIGCQSHGRAAWGDIHRPYPAEGFVIEGDVAILDAETYDLPKKANYVVALSDVSFLTNDGRSGEEWFPHGGIFPEEVFVPWVELVRDAVVLDLEATVTGHGRAGGTGQLELALTNPNEFQLTLVRLVLRYDHVTREVKLETGLRPRTKESLRYDLADWPTTEQCRDAKATLSYRLPSGDSNLVEIQTVQLSSEELYQKTNILEGLL